MRMFLASFVSAALVAAAATPAAAQLSAPRPERPYRGLFAGDTGNAQQLLTLSASFGGGYDDDIFANNSTAGTSNNGGSTSFLSGSAGLGYSLSKAKKAFSASVGGGVGHYPGLQEPTITHFNAGVNASMQVGRHSSISFSQTETYQPFYFWSAFPGEIAPVDTTPVFDPGTMTIADAVQATALGIKPLIAADGVVGQEAEYYLDSDTSVGFTQGLSEHLSLTGGYNYRRSDSQSGIRDFESQGGSAHLGYSLGKGLSIGGGFGYSVNDYPRGDGLVDRYESKTIDGGVNYNKALSFSRRTTLTFSTGMSGVSYGGEVHYGLLGNVQLVRELGRTWSTSVGYSRNVSFSETFRAPVLSDNLFGGIGGLLSRQWQFHASAGASRGDVGYGSANGFQSYVVSTGARYAFMRKAGLSVYYAYYRYSFENGIVLPPGISKFTNRQSFGFSVDTWVPLLQRNRSANATR